MKNFIKNFRVRGSDFTDLPELFDPEYFGSWIAKDCRFNPFALMRRWGIASDIMWVMDKCPTIFNTIMKEGRWVEVTKFLMKEFHISATEALFLLLRGCPSEWEEEHGYEFARGFYKKFKPCGDDFFYLFKAVDLVELLPPDICLDIVKMGCPYRRAAFLLLLWNVAEKNIWLRRYFWYIKTNLEIKYVEEIKKNLNLIL